MTRTVPHVQPDGAKQDAAQRRSGLRRAAELLAVERFSGVYVLIAVIVVFSVLEPSTFATTQNVRAILSDQAIAAMVALGLVVALNAGMFDVSIGHTMGWSVMFVCWLQVNGMSPLLACVLAVASGVLIGLFNGVVVVRMRVPSIIATLGTGSILAALTYWIAGGRAIVEGIPESFVAVAQAQLLGIPLPVFYLTALALLLWFVLQHTEVGRHMTAVGGNPKASKLAGLAVSRLQIAALTASATISSLAGVFYASRLGSAALEAGTPYLLPAFAAAFLGSTQLRPGRFNVAGTLVAIFLLATGVKGLQLMYSNLPWLPDLFQGAALIIAVALAARGLRRRQGGDAELRTH